MVTSGLFDRFDVSPLRLAIHLAMAFVILALALVGGAWRVSRGRSKTSKLGLPRWAPFVLMALIFVQIMFGALLAGSDGGPAYADWPKIGGEWIPSSAFGLEPLWHNFTEDHATQHLLHRSMGYFVGSSRCCSRCSA
jgi:cytochrome c oxidase assembly protein subunit 15